ncbi:hypothetical protein [Actinoplanes cyaneus]|nr:hypothetical protein [Actinoplanes cyaneus]
MATFNHLESIWHARAIDRFRRFTYDRHNDHRWAHPHLPQGTRDPPGLCPRPARWPACAVVTLDDAAVESAATLG